MIIDMSKDTEKNTYIIDKALKSNKMYNKNAQILTDKLKNKINSEEILSSNGLEINLSFAVSNNDDDLAIFDFELFDGEDNPAFEFVLCFNIVKKTYAIKSEIFIPVDFYTNIINVVKLVLTESEREKVLN